MTTTPPADALSEATRALIAATQRRLDEAQQIKSPADLGIVADRRRNGRRRPGSVKHRAIR